MGSALIPLAPSNTVPGDPPLASGIQTIEVANGTSSSTVGDGFDVLFATLVSSASAPVEEPETVSIADNLLMEVVGNAEVEVPAGPAGPKVALERGAVAGVKSRSPLLGLGFPLPPSNAAVPPADIRRPATPREPLEDDSEAALESDDAAEAEPCAIGALPIPCSVELPKPVPTPEPGSARVAPRTEGVDAGPGEAGESTNRASLRAQTTAVVVPTLDGPGALADPSAAPGRTAAAAPAWLEVSAASTLPEVSAAPARPEAPEIDESRRIQAPRSSPEAGTVPDESAIGQMKAPETTEEPAVAEGPREEISAAAAQAIPPQMLAAFSRTSAVRTMTSAGGKVTEPVEVDTALREPAPPQQAADLDGVIVQSSKSSADVDERLTAPAGLRPIRVQPADRSFISTDANEERLLVEQQAADEGQTRRVPPQVARAFEAETPILRAIKATVSTADASGVTLPVTGAASRLAEAAVDAYGQLSTEGATPLPTTGPFEGQPHEQVVRAIRLQWQHGIGEARLALQPENLGRVDVQLRVEQGTVTAVLRTDTADAATWIRNHHGDLRQALADQGLDLDSFEVVVDPESRRRQNGRPRDETEYPARNRRRSAEQSVFDIHV